MRTGYADAPLHGGRAPAWLFQRMARLAREMSLAIVAEEGSLRPPTPRLRSVLVPGVRLGARLRLALQWNHDDNVRRAERGLARVGERGRPLRVWGQGEDVPAHSK